MQRMLSLLRRTLTDLVMAIEGTIIMSDDLKEVLDNMFDAKVCVASTNELGKSSTILKTRFLKSGPRSLGGRQLLVSGEKKSLHFLNSVQNSLY